MSSRRGVKRTLAGTPRELSRSTMTLNQLLTICHPHCIPFKLSYDNTYAICSVQAHTEVVSYYHGQYLKTTGMVIGNMLESKLLKAGITEGNAPTSFRKLITPDGFVYIVPVNAVDLDGTYQKSHTLDFCG